jgi:hypothetical protein
MKKIIFCMMAAFLSFTFLPLQSSAVASEPASSLVAEKPSESTEVKTLELRLTEINSMDKSVMKTAEKRELRKEVKSINHKLREIGGGVYISAGAIILILILLIVLL